MARFLVALSLLVTFGGETLSAEEPNVRKYPVQMSATIKKLGQTGQQQVVIKLTIKQGIHIYAGHVGSEMLKSNATRVALKNADKTLIAAKVDYPTGMKMENEFLGDFFVYKDTVTIRVTIDRKDNNTPITIQCRVMGFHPTY